MSPLLLIICLTELLAAGILLALLLRGKKKQAQLEHELGSFENIVAHTNDALFVIEIINGKVLHANYASANLLGYKVEELEKKTYFDLLPEEDVAKSAEIIADVWEKKGMVFTDIPYRRSDGSVVPVECSAKVGEFDGHPAIVIYARDIRERLRYEKEIKQINEELKLKNKEITDSIRYAQRIQQAILPQVEESTEILPEHFVMFRPKDIVSGDFYMIDSIHTNEGVSLVGFAVVDCTGHGVPGACLSLLGRSFFKQSMTEESVNTPGEALDFVNKNLVNVLRYKESANVRDGMDASFCVLNTTTGLLLYSGANNQICVISEGRLTELNPDKRSIGQEVDQRKFTTQRMQLKKGDMIYLFSDGYADQFGGPKGKKFKYRQLEEMFLKTSALSASEQKKVLNDTFDEWKGSLEQVDDVTVMGIRY